MAALRWRLLRYQPVGALGATRRYPSKRLAKWFVYGFHAETAKRMCANCPVRRACALSALHLGATDGIWAGVRLPGCKFPDELDAARNQLRRVAEAMAHQPEAHRRRTLLIRAALLHTHHIQTGQAGA